MVKLLILIALGVAGFMVARKLIANSGPELDTDDGYFSALSNDATV